MAKVSFGKRGGRVRKTTSGKAVPQGSPDEVVRKIKEAQEKGLGEEYREQSLRIHGLICARCTREFDNSNRNLLTVHHKDGNHQNNPPDGSNWENLCVYCHEDAHSRGLLSEYVSSGEKEQGAVVFGEKKDRGLGKLGDKLRRAMERKKT